MKNPLPIVSIVRGQGVPPTFLRGLDLSLIEFSKKVSAREPSRPIRVMIFCATKVFCGCTRGCLSS